MKRSCVEAAAPPLQRIFPNLSLISGNTSGPLLPGFHQPGNILKNQAAHTSGASGSDSSDSPTGPLCPRVSSHSSQVPNRPSASSDALIHVQLHLKGSEAGKTGKASVKHQQSEEQMDGDPSVSSPVLTSIDREIGSL